jgi:ABC-type transport system involved in multi-copper enzyme maturation permease subunit
MVLAIVNKELREIRFFAALALVLYAVHLSRLTGHWNHLLALLLGWLPGLGNDPPDLPLLDSGFSITYGLIGVALAIAIGFRQSAWEPSQGTALFLLHRPMSRRAILLTKLLTGLGVQLVCTLVPILIYTSWLAMPGTYPGPFHWSMAGPIFRLWLVMPLLYLGAFASGIRPARWLGSRLLPLLAATMPAVVVPFLPLWWLVGWPALVIAAAMFVWDILLEAEARDH